MTKSKYTKKIFTLKPGQRFRKQTTVEDLDIIQDIETHLEIKGNR